MKHKTHRKAPAKVVAKVPEKAPVKAPEKVAESVVETPVHLTPLEQKRAEHAEKVRLIQERNDAEALANREASKAAKAS
jgi:hypothetical protein